MIYNLFEEYFNGYLYNVLTMYIFIVVNWKYTLVSAMCIEKFPGIDKGSVKLLC